MTPVNPVRPTTSAVGAAARRCAVVSLVCLPVAAMAFDFSGDKQLFAHTPDGAPTRIGTVRFSPGDAVPEVRFVVKLDTSVLTDYFLSMREFKCLPGAAEVTCAVPYPYAHPGTITPGNLAWLEHNLLFLYKRPTDFGAKLWNGVIFQFKDEGRALVGRPQAIDLNHISAPPEPSSGLPQLPYGAGDRDDFLPNARWIRSLTIE